MGANEWSQLPSPLRKRFSEEAIKFYESLLQEHGPDPDLQYETAVGYRAIGTLHTTAGESQEAEKSIRLSTTILEQLATQHPAVQRYREQWAWSLVCLGRAVIGNHPWEETANVYQQGADLFQKLISENPDSIDYRGELTTCCRELARLRMDRGDFQHAESVLRTGIASMEESSLPPSAFVNRDYIMAEMHMSLAKTLIANRRLPEAKAELRVATKRYEALVTDMPNVWRLSGWGDCYMIPFDFPSEVFTISERERAFRDYFKIRIAHSCQSCSQPRFTRAIRSYVPDVGAHPRKC